MEITPQIRGAVEAVLFVSDEPVSAARIARVLDEPEEAVASALESLSSEFADQERGFQLREVAGGWRLFTHPAYHERIESYVLSWDARKLSQAALEALAVIAYHQPVTRGSVNAVRGVNSEGVMSSLVDKGLVRESGRDRNQGNAILYVTTRTFLEKFGLKDLSELPPLEEFAPDPRTERAIRERLGALDGSALAEDAGAGDVDAAGSAGGSGFDVREFVVDRVEFEPDGEGPCAAADEDAETSGVE